MQRNDIIEDFENYAEQLDWFFSYGNKANQNLLQSDLEVDKKYLILDPVRRLKKFSEYGGVKGIDFSGSFILVVKSTIDQEYYKNKDGVLSGKYNENIKPLINIEIKKLEDLFNCSSYNVTEWSIIDVTDIFDVNLDGLIVNFKMSIL